MMEQKPFPTCGACGEKNSDCTCLVLELDDVDTSDYWNKFEMLKTTKNGSIDRHESFKVFYFGKEVEIGEIRDRRFLMRWILNWESKLEKLERSNSILREFNAQIPDDAIREIAKRLDCAYDCLESILVRSHS